MTTEVRGFQELDRTMVAIAGGKGANLGELARLPGVRVPDGFCITADAYARVVAAHPTVRRLLDQLPGHADPVALGAELRHTIEELAIPADLEAAIAQHLARLGASDAYAVRSSATAEDLPTASFAGQHDTFLNVVGQPAILAQVRRCWASLFTARAVAYRRHQGLDHRQVRMAVVVQRMVAPQAAGTMFTADPVTSDRTVVSIDAALGLGEALVAGLVSPDVYKVRAGEVVARQPAAGRPALTDAQALRLAEVGRAIEAHLGQPQDIEWCLADDALHVVQSRPITTLFPIPAVDDQARHVYVSVGHQQMMTDPMKPLGQSMWQLLAARPMFAAAGRMFVDVAPQLASPAMRGVIVDALGTSDPLIKDALEILLARDYIPLVDDPAAPGAQPPAWMRAPADPDPTIIPSLIAESEAAVEEARRTLWGMAGTAVFDFIQADLQAKRATTDPRGIGLIVAAQNAAAWLNEHMLAWLGEKNAADALSQSVPNNITSEMGLALLDVADAIRPHPAVIAYLEQANDAGFLEGLDGLDGGQEAHDALEAFLGKYGVRCVGEIDVARPRWRERPTALVPLLLANVRNFEPGARARRFEHGLSQARAKEQTLLARLRDLPDGDRKAAETKRMIDLLRSAIGYREYPKYAIVSRLAVYKDALAAEAATLARAGALRDAEDAWYLTFQELREAVATHRVDQALIDRRKAEHRHFETLTPPRVMTSEGEVLTGAYRRADLPAGALVGLAVSAGVVEGRARVLTRLEGAALEPGDILVTPFTDPSWTPAFVAIRGLVTEVGGLMTHGAVIAREYGLPAVVGVEHATRRIRDGQRIRVNGTEGYVEVV